MTSPVMTALVGALLLCGAEGARRDEPCRFPAQWEGTWFQSGVRQPIVISEARLSSKGRCVASEGDKFVVVDDKGNYRCVVIHEKHVNVLQYKETYGHARESLSTLCALITGDALLYSMFRVEATPVPCPFRGPFTFTYNRGHGDCRVPVSSIEACTEDSRLLLRYQACPDVHGTESTVEELQCLATWKEGSSRYLVGKLHHNHALSNEERYRCFVYERVTPEDPSAAGSQGLDYRVAQSGDATCNGLFSPMEGSRTMTLHKAMLPSHCRFPQWLTASQHWHSLDYTRLYYFHHRNSTLRITNTTAVGTSAHNASPGFTSSLTAVQPLMSDFGQELRVVCSEVQEVTDGATLIVGHFTAGCQSGYVCLMFYRRDGHVIEVQTGEPTRRPEDACHRSHFDRSTLPFVTLVTSSPEPRQCPYLGKFSVTGMSQGGQRRRRSRGHEEGHHRRMRDLPPAACTTMFDTLVVGCSTADTMEFRSGCATQDVVSAYSCHGRWEDNGTHYLITTPLARSSHGARRYCFMYRETEGVVSFSSSPASCQRDVRPGVGGALAFNATSSGQCLDASTATPPPASMGPALLLLLAAFAR